MGRQIIPSVVEWALWVAMGRDRKIQIRVSNSQKVASGVENQKVARKVASGVSGMVNRKVASGELQKDRIMAKKIGPRFVTFTRGMAIASGEMSASVCMKGSEER